jgi:hypothetical protein
MRTSYQLPPQLGDQKVPPVAVVQTARPVRPSRWRSLPAAAGLAYSVTWIVGLAVWPTNLSIGSSHLAVTNDYRAHAGHAIAQYALVEGVAGLLLAVVIGSLIRTASTRHGSIALRIAVVTGTTAAALSVTQFVIGMVLVAYASDGHVASAGTAFDLVNRLDGVKMLLIAATAVGLAAPRRSTPLPNWLAGSSDIAAIALAVSGVTYIALASGLAWIVYVSGPLLVLWVPAIAYWSAGTHNDASVRNHEISDAELVALTPAS